MGRIYETHSLTIETMHDRFSFVVGMIDLNGQLVEQILYDTETKHVQVITVDGSFSLNARQRHFDIDGHAVRCAIHVGSLIREHTPKRPLPPPPLRPNYLDEHRQNLQVAFSVKLEAEKENLEKQLDSMRKAYQSEELENRNLRQMIEELSGGTPSRPSDSRQIVENNHQLEHQLHNYQYRSQTLLMENRHLQSQLEQEKKVSGTLHEDTRKRFVAWGVALTTAQIVDLLFRFLG